jgi:hypothetical protein
MSAGFEEENVTAECLFDLGRVGFGPPGKLVRIGV